MCFEGHLGRTCSRNVALQAWGGMGSRTSSHSSNQGGPCLSTTKGEGALRFNCFSQHEMGLVRPLQGRKKKNLSRLSVAVVVIVSYLMRGLCCTWYLENLDHTPLDLEVPEFWLDMQGDKDLSWVTGIPWSQIIFNTKVFLNCSFK